MWQLAKLLVFPAVVLVISWLNWAVKKDQKSKQQLLMGSMIAVFLLLYDLIWHLIG